MFAREGYLIIAVVALVAAALVAAGLASPPWLGWVLYIVAALALGFTLYFFRDPHRVFPGSGPTSNLLLAPADGKVIVLADIEHEPLYIKGPARQISIFLSPLNVHVNRAPADGEVEYERYVPGEYLVAWHPKASEKNERSELGTRHPNGTKVLFKQIAGAVARRIVYYPKVGDQLTAGERYGIVKFGSRMDILVPPHVVIDARLGDKVTAGVTILGHITSPDAVTDTAQPQAASASS